MSHVDNDGNAITAADARNRALRTFLQGLAVDVAVAVLGALALAFDATPVIPWTKAYWATIAVLLVKTAVQSAVAYVARRALPPRL